MTREGLQMLSRQPFCAMAGFVAVHRCPASATGRPRMRHATTAVTRNAVVDRTVVQISAVSQEVAESAYTNAKREVTRRIKAFGKSGHIKKAVNELTEAARMGIPIDTQLATALVDVCVQNQKMDLAETLFDDLFREHVDPDDVTFCSLIRGFGGVEDFTWDEILRILSRMENEFGIKPTLNVYNALLEICAQRNDSVQAEMFLEQMAVENLKPDGLTLRVVRNRRAIRKRVKQLERELATDSTSI